MRLDHLLSKENMDWNHAVHTSKVRKCWIHKDVKLFNLEGTNPPKVGEDGAFVVTRGCSSVGRAPALQAGGRGFESLHLHHELEKVQRRQSGQAARNTKYRNGLIAQLVRARA